MHRASPILCFALAACGPMVAATDEGGTSIGPATSSSSATTMTVTTASTSDATTSSTTTSTSTDESTGQVDSSTDGTRPDVPTCPPLSCGGFVYGCTDGVDNDRDGVIDLDDPGCVGVCDDSEDELGASLPGDYITCKPDCFFDGNSGNGDDSCVIDLRCDPEDPGALIGCEYVGHPNEPQCDGWLDPPAPECVAFCEPYALPGCDCFGCCTFTTDDGTVDLFLDSTSNCTPEDLAACQPCTPRIEECGNVCGGCEICIGQSAPPDGCRTNACDNDRPCTTHDDCECGSACILGCCIPPPPG